LTRFWNPLDEPESSGSATSHAETSPQDDYVPSENGFTDQVDADSSPDSVESSSTALSNTSVSRTGADLCRLLADLTASLRTDGTLGDSAPVDIHPVEAILEQSSNGNEYFSLLSTKVMLLNTTDTIYMTDADDLDGSFCADSGSRLTPDPGSLEAHVWRGIRRCVDANSLISDALGSDFSYADPEVSDDGFLIVVPVRVDRQVAGAVAAAGFGAVEKCVHFFSVVAALIERRLENQRFRSEHESILNEVIIAHSDLSSLDLSSNGLSFETEHDITTRSGRSVSDNILTTYLNSPIVMLVVDRVGTIHHVSRYAIECLGYDVQELVGSNLSILYGNTGGGDVAARLTQSLATPGQLHRHECGVRRADGTWLQIREQLGVADGFDDHCLIVLQDVTDTYRRSRELEYRANHDGLTGLVNRDEFERRLEQAIRAVSLDGASHTLCYLDLDHFKGINDSSGHNAGDEILKQMAQLFISQIRQSDTIARLGGDEFAVLMEFCTLENAQRLAEDIRSAVANFEFEWQGRSFSTSVSIGMTTIDQADDVVADVMARADAACYEAKGAGRNQISVDIGAVATKPNTPEHRRQIALDNAFASDSFEIYRQPFRTSPDTSGDVGSIGEIQIRLPRLDGPSLREKNFMSSVESNGLSQRLDDWVLKTVCDRLADDRGELSEICWVNISRASMGDTSFAERLAHLIDSRQIDASRLCLSSTVSTIHLDTARSKNQIRQLHSIGCKVAIDEFGSGASLGLLRQFEFDYCRLSRSLTVRPEYSALDLAIIQAIVDVCCVAKVRTVVGNLNLQTQIDALQGIGLDYLHGDHIEASVPVC